MSGPWSEFEVARMREALALAENGLFTTTPNPRVGCVLVRDGVVVGRGFTQPPGGDHAEIRAMKDCQGAGETPRGTMAFVTLEPCDHFGRTPPCTNALIDAGVAEVIASTHDPNPLVAGRGIARLASAGVRTRVGLLAEEARALNVGFCSRMERGRPWVRAKIAASLDGRTALANGQSRWITGPEARRDGHRWRARACAVATGIGTVLADDPQLDVREVTTPRQPMCVVFDWAARTPPEARVLRREKVIVITAGPTQSAWPAHAITAAIPGADGKVDLAEALAFLAREHQVNELHLEAGSGLNGSMLRAGLIDELLLYFAPRILGDGAEGMFRLGTIDAIAAGTAVEVIDLRSIGEDWRVIARVRRDDGGNGCSPGS